MPTLTFRIADLAGRIIRNQCVREFALQARQSRRQGGYVLAVTHVSHLEPFLVSMAHQRQIHWLARQEFYRHPVSAWFLRKFDCIEVNRFGVPVQAMRRSIDLARAGRVVGIFPEAGVAVGAKSVLRGGPIKGGAAMISYHAQVPILPLVVLGTNRLNRVSPWLPAKRARVHMAFGEPLAPSAMLEPVTPSRQVRLEYTRRLGEAFRATYAELLARADLPADYLP